MGKRKTKAIAAVMMTAALMWSYECYRLLLAGSRMIGPVVWYK